jgi:prevent-host-death family protein
MKTASVRDLRNTYNDLLRWVEAGEEVVIQRRGKPVARLVPDKRGEAPHCEWSGSAAFRRDKSQWPVLSAEQALSVVHEASGKW